LIALALAVREVITSVSLVDVTNDAGRLHGEVQSLSHELQAKLQEIEGREILAIRSTKLSGV
jgi:hypothetical protein